MSIYRDSKRIVGTNADRIGTDAIAGGWKEVGRTTLGSVGDTISVSSLPAKRYYMILQNILDGGGGSNTTWNRLNNDSGSNYARRIANNGGADGTSLSATEMRIDAWGGGTDKFFVTYLANKSDKEKLMLGEMVDAVNLGAGNAPNRSEYSFKWTNTSNDFSRIDALNQGSGNYASGSEVVVLGYDPDDTHTDNFWEELASVDLSGGAADEVSSGTITAKKYLWVQFFGEASGSIQETFRFNNDTGSNYARRMSSNGGADSTDTSVSACSSGSADSTNHFYNLFIINNSSNEKLIIGHQIRAGSAGAGNAPDRREYVYKWANTSSQITEIDVGNNSTGDFGTNSFLKVWGAD